MRSLFVRLLPLAFLLVSLATPSNAPARSMLDIPGVPVAGLKVYMPEEAYKKLINAPVKAYILVQGQVANNRVYGARVTHSETNRVFDKIAVQMANSMEVYSDMVGTRVPGTVLIHVLIYGLPDGSEDALAVAQNDTMRTNLIYSRSIMIRHLGLANQSNSKPSKKK